MTNFTQGQTAQPPPVWEVVDVRDSTRYAGASGIVATKVITVRLNTDRSEFQVEVDKAQFTPANVAKLIEAQVANELDVRDLRSGVSLESLS